MNKLLLITALILSSCGSQLEVKKYNPQPVTYFPVASATINVSTYGQLSFNKPSMYDLILPKAHAQVGQGSATVNVVYNNPSATVFTVNTANLGNAITVTGDDLNLGTVSISGLDDNTLRVCTGVGAPGNRCNRLFIRVFTLGTATGGITNTPGFINRDGLYGIDVFAGNVSTPLGFNASPIAGAVTNAAIVYTYNIPNGVNRVRLSQLTIPTIPVKADLSNAGNGQYEMNLVVQYALAYSP